MLAYRVAVCSQCGGKRRLIEGASLRAIRERTGLSLRECARRFGVSAPYLSDVERNRRNCTATLLKKYQGVTHG